MTLPAPRAPGLHDAVTWRGARWIVTRVLNRGRFEITVMRDPTVQWVCRNDQLTWDESIKAWVCNAYLVPLRGSQCGD
jgi:hypothetical protein